MLDILLIFIGAGLGGVLRFLVSNFTYLFFSREFPYGTLIVNVTGCFLMGLLLVVLLEKTNGIQPHFRSLILTGLLGGYTTFSSFSIETFTLFENGAMIAALMNILLSVLLCLLAVWLGVLGGRQL